MLIISKIEPSKSSHSACPVKDPEDFAGVSAVEIMKFLLKVRRTEQKATLRNFTLCF